MTRTPTYDCRHALQGTGKLEMNWKIRTLKAVVAVAVMGLTGACASTPQVFSQVDPTADFSSYRTYGYYDNPATDNAQYESLVTNFLKVSVAGLS